MIFRYIKIISDTKAKMILCTAGLQDLCTAFKIETVLTGEKWLSCIGKVLLWERYTNPNDSSFLLIHKYIFTSLYWDEGSRYFIHLLFRCYGAFKWLNKSSYSVKPYCLFTHSGFLYSHTNYVCNAVGLITRSAALSYNTLVSR